MSTIIQKQTWLLDTIRRCRRVTFPELSRKWENNTELNPDGKHLVYRTFNRHVDEIQQLYGISIVCDRRTNEYFISNTEDVEAGTLKNWLLDTIATESLVRDCKTVSDRILFESIPKGREHLLAIIDAIKGNLELEITYHTFWNPDAYITRVQPYFLKAYKQRWYLVGISDRHPGQIRIFGLDRIQHIDVTSVPFSFPENFNPVDYCSKSYGIFLSNKSPEIVKLKVTENQQSFLRSLPLHWSQEEIEANENYSIFQYFLSPEYDFEQELLSRASTIEVLEPEWLRADMKSRIQSMLSLYE